MFCKKCGMKIERGGSKCSHCGEPASTAEYCGGFWGITRLEQGNTEKQRNNLATEDLSKYRDAVLAAQKTEEKMSRQYSEEIRTLKAERRNLDVSCLKRTLLAVVLGLFAVVFLVLMVRGSFRIKKMEKDLAGQQKQIEESAEEHAGNNSTGTVPDEAGGTTQDSAVSGPDEDLQKEHRDRQNQKSIFGGRRDGK